MVSFALSNFLDHSNASLAREGDAGAWVVDDESRVCGYIVASDYDSKTTYFRPMDVAFRDIRKVLRAKNVCLPVFRAPTIENSVNTSLDRRASDTGEPADRLLATDDKLTPDVEAVAAPPDIPENNLAATGPFRVPNESLTLEVEQAPKAHQAPNDVLQIQDGGPGWYCCNCGSGGNSYYTSVCRYCNNHWRCDRCAVVMGH